MSFIIDDMRRVLLIKTKARHDGVCDHYSRVFMPKIMCFFSLMIGVNWYFDKLTCIIPKTLSGSHQFITDVCWINGFYIYENLTTTMTSYYGIPKNINEDGISITGILCETSYDEGCTPMVKFYYLQYQWFPFFLASFVILYIIPHLGFKFINADLITLKNAVRVHSCDEIFESYFNLKQNTPTQMFIKVFGSIAVKVAYIFSNVGTFYAIDHSLNKKYLNYASNWLYWTYKNNSAMFDYSIHRQSFRAGEVLLPNYGLCDVQILFSDMIESGTNKYSIICEYSTHVLYHYVLILLWFLIVFGIIFSTIGLINQTGKYFLMIYIFPRNWKNKEEVFNVIFLREKEYLIYINSQNIVLYELLLDKLRLERLKITEEEGNNSLVIEKLNKKVIEIRIKVENILHKQTFDINEPTLGIKNKTTFRNNFQIKELR
ncbi:uncharacterized protein LOC105849405 [Hydra vulgaris]|uniref:uncharacterized protein LOC105849405 n=1 Tax=Hydra vulgaris TaxID=6087 RepID=UPI001F5F8708|nr:uncharacterized protein LOC105849405 [Hydra vulgaris]